MQRQHRRPQRFKPAPTLRAVAPMFSGCRPIFPCHIQRALFSQQQGEYPSRGLARLSRSTNNNRRRVSRYPANVKPKPPTLLAGRTHRTSSTPNNPQSILFPPTPISNSSILKHHPPPTHQFIQNESPTFLFPGGHRVIYEPRTADFTWLYVLSLEILPKYYRRLSLR